MHRRTVSACGWHEICSRPRQMTPLSGQNVRLVGSSAAAALADRHDRGFSRGELWEAPQPGWSPQALEALRRRPTMLYRSKNEFGLFELGDGCWKEVARLEDAARPGAQRFFRYLLQHHMPESKKLTVRLSEDYVSCHSIMIDARRKGEALIKAEARLPGFLPEDAQDAWRGCAIAGERLDDGAFRCRAAFARKRHLDEIDFQLQAFGRSLGEAEYADAETDTLIRLKSPEPPQARRKRRGILVRALVGVLLLVFGASAANLAVALGERAGLDAKLARLGDAPTQWYQFPVHPDKPVPPPDLAKLSGDRTSVAALLKHLGEILPGDAVLTSVKVRNGEVRFSGRARTTEGLLKRVAMSGLLRDPDYAAPTVRMNDKGVEVFSIKAALNAVPKAIEGSGT